MLQAARCGDLRDRGAIARRVASENYGLEHMVRRYEELYRRLLPAGAK